MEGGPPRKRGRPPGSGRKLATKPAAIGPLFANHALFALRPTSDSYVKSGVPRPNSVFDTYWRFAALRQDIFFNKIRNPTRPPWTEDPILRKHKFTNAYRASDRASQYLINKVIYVDDESLKTPEEIFFRTILFKVFNTIDTWELLKKELGEVRFGEYKFDRLDYILSAAINAGTRIYSAAYIMPSGRSTFHLERKHSNHLRLIEKMMEEKLPDRLYQRQPELGDVYRELLAFPGIGPFLAYQYAIDLNYGPLLSADENSFVMPGPGALDGIAKCFDDDGGLTPADLIRWTCEHQTHEFARLGIDFRDLWGRELKLIDCQNLFCEVDKYARVKHPDAVGLSGRTRIKQLYRPTSGIIRYRYPPKWGINERIEQSAK